MMGPKFVLAGFVGKLYCTVGFHHLAKQLSQFCQFPISLSKTTLTEEQQNINVNQT